MKKLVKVVGVLRSLATSVEYKATRQMNVEAMGRKNRRKEEQKESKGNRKEYRGKYLRLC